MSACRSRGPSPMPASACCSSTSTRDASRSSTRGESYIEDVPTEVLEPLVEAGLVAATTDYDELRDADAILVALPTPLSRQREPDLRILVSAAEQIADAAATRTSRRARVDDVPGDDARAGAADPRAGQRAQGRARTSTSRSRPSGSIPAREDWTTKNVPKVVGGIDESSTAAAVALYASAIDSVHPVSSPEAAELTKLLENIFRSVNIALVNELAQLCDRMNIDVWEVIDAAATKPFGFMSFKPGPGPGRPLHPDRPLLPHLEGARVRLLHRVHRARREGQRVDAVLLPLRRLAGAEPRPPALALRLEDPRARRRVQARHLGHARVARA